MNSNSSSGESQTAMRVKLNVFMTAAAQPSTVGGGSNIILILTMFFLDSWLQALKMMVFMKLKVNCITSCWLLYVV